MSSELKHTIVDSSYHENVCSVSEEEVQPPEHMDTPDVAVTDI